MSDIPNGITVLDNTGKVNAEGVYQIQPVTGSGIALGGDVKVYFTPVLPIRKTDLSEDKLQTALVQLRDKVEQYFDIAAEALHDNPTLQEEIIRSLQEIKEELRVIGKKPLSYVISEQQFNLRKIHVAIASEQKIQQGERWLIWVVPILVIVYIVMIILTIVFGDNVWLQTSTIPVIGVPISVVIWAAIGSIAAILYRFYTRKRGRLYDEVRWLIARPVIGIIMGSFAYLVILSGLLVFGDGTNNETLSTTPRPQLLWLVAFLGGFSDKFYQAIIRLVVGRLTNNSGENEQELTAKPPHEG
jgi:hypothetical protein